MATIVANRKDVAELLLANGAKVNARNNDGRTALHEAADAGNKDVLELLLANKADVNAKANNGDTPLHVAMIHGYKDIAELLRQHDGHE
jgi:ankyrin repeat protein